MAATIWKGRLNFGLVSVPIKLFRAARAEKIHMHKIQRDTGARLRQVFVPAEAPVPAPAPVPVAAPAPAPVAAKGIAHKPAPVAVPPPAPPAPAPLARQDIVHGYEYEKNKYVEFEPEEIARMAPRSSPDMEIVEFVKFDEVDPVYLETSYYVAPDAGGDKPYALLYQALKKTGYAAIGEFVMHRRDQIAILRPGRRGLVLHTLFYEDEVKRDLEYHAPADSNAKEMELAVKLVEALAGAFDPARFKDKYRERLREAIAQKLESGEVAEAAEPASKAPVVDIMAALKESLAKARKPVARESRPAAAKKTKGSRIL